jgi:hypothetical protein
LPDDFGQLVDFRLVGWVDLELLDIFSGYLSSTASWYTQPLRQQVFWFA